MTKLVQTENKHLTYISCSSREWKMLNDNSQELLYDGHLWEICAVAFIHDDLVFVDIKNNETKQTCTKMFEGPEVEIFKTFKTILKEND